MVAANKKITKKINLLKKDLKQTSSLCSASFILGAPAPGRPNGFQTGAFSAKNNGIKK
jgi:hypothetical protein